MFQNPVIATEERDGLPNPQRIWAVMAASLALVMSVLDANIVNIVLPTLSREFGTTPSTTIWVMNAYQLAITVSLLSFSSLGDIYGYRRVFLSGVVDGGPGFARLWGSGYYQRQYGSAADPIPPQVFRQGDGHQCYGGCCFGCSRALRSQCHTFFRKLALAIRHQYPFRLTGLGNGTAVFTQTGRTTIS